MARRFLYKAFDVTVYGEEYFITNEILGVKELIHFKDDLECIHYINKKYYQEG